MWELTRIAVEFFREHLPFSEMDSADALTPRADDYCLAKPGAVYALYLPSAEATEIDLSPGSFTVRWFNPRKGGSLRLGSLDRVVGPGRQTVGVPPSDPNRDWVCLIRLAAGE